MQRPIVCGIDGSEQGARALSTANWLANRLDARLIAVHVVPQPSGRTGRGFGSYAQASDAAEKRGNVVLAEALDRPGLPARLARRVEHGDPAERLLSAARDENAGVVVVGSHGSGALRTMLLGSVSRQLVSSCDCPVVVVPPEAELPGCERRVESLVCGVDGSQAAERGLAVASALASALGLRLTLAHVYLPERSQAAIPAPSGVLPVDVERLNEIAKRKGAEVLDDAEQLIRPALDVRPRLLAGDPAASLTELAARERAAMVVLGSRGHGPSRRPCSDRSRARSCGARESPWRSPRRR